MQAMRNTRMVGSEKKKSKHFISFHFVSGIRERLHQQYCQHRNISFHFISGIRERLQQQYCQLRSHVYLEGEDIGAKL